MRTLLEEIASEVCVCAKCPLSRSRMNAVPGDGPEDSRIIFVGEAPGREEDRQGLPFVGPAGRLLNDLLTQAGLRREDVFITNIIKCRPPQNRDPMPSEIEACHEYLVGQIAAIRPAVLCTLGSPALRTLVDPKLSIGRVHGTSQRRGGILYVPLYHPAAAIHNPSLRRTIIEDMAKVAPMLQQAQRL